MGSIPQLSILKGPSSSVSETSPSSLYSLLSKNSQSYPQNTALLSTDNKGKTWRVTYCELDLTSNRLARGIASLIRDSEPNSDGDLIVAVSAPPSHRLVQLLAAIWKAGCPYLPLDPCSPPERTRHILSESKPALLITDQEIDEDKEEYSGVQRISLKELEERSAEEGEFCLKNNRSSKPLAMVLYTSGSTGVPKGVRVPQSAVLNRLEWQWKRFPYGDTEEICIFKTALTFVDSVSEIWGPLLHPGQPRTVLVVSSHLTKDPHHLVKLLHNNRVQRLVLVPSLLRAILMYLKLYKNKIVLLDRLKLWVCSGEPLPVSLAQEFLEIFQPTEHTLCNFYGSTEVMGDVTYHAITSADEVEINGKVPIGVAMDNTCVYLLDEALRPVGHGAVGEIFVSGRNLALGYVKQRDQHRFIENPLALDPEHKLMYRTGDFARLEKGVIVFEGRKDSQIKVRGHRVDLTEVEAAISQLSGIKKAVVLCYKPADINQTIVGFVLPEEETTLFEKDLEIALQSFLPSYAIPQILIINHFPLLINGKVDRQTLLKLYDEVRYKESKEALQFDMSGISTEHHAAALCLFKTIASVIGVKEEINGKANFYELGGNSLNSVYSITLLRDQGYLISVGDFISAKNLGEIVTRMKHESELLHVDMKDSSFKYSHEMLKQNHKSKVARMVEDSFYNKADLEKWVVPPVERIHYQQYVDLIWESLVDANLSYVVLNSKGDSVGVAMNFDANDEPDVEINSPLHIVFNFLEYLEGPIRRSKLPSGKGKVMHSFMMATDSSLTGSQNVEVMEFMEMINLRLAKERNFDGVFTTNTSPLTQQLGVDVFHYQVLLSYQVNQFVASNGTRPFKEAPDDQLTLCCWKPL